MRRTCSYAAMTQGAAPRRRWTFYEAVKHGHYLRPAFRLMYRIRSLILVEYPHSLSYHAITLTILLSRTLVMLPSTIEECGFPLKSMDTRGSSVYSKIPLSLPSAARFNALLTFASSTSFSTSATRSIMDTFGVGTLTAIPSIFPSSSGITKEIARAAPVVVGISDTAAALARRRSL